MMVGKVRKLHNPHKRPKSKKNTAKRRRNMSAKQIRHFGTKAQKAALKRRRSVKAKSNPRRKRAAKTKVVYRTRTRTVKAKSNPKRRRKARRSNPLQMVTLGLVNPRRRKSVATKTKKRRKSNPGGYKRRRKASVTVGRRRNKTVRHHRRRSTRNPAVFGVSGIKGLGEILAGGAGGILLGNSIPGFLPSALTANPIFTALSTAIVGWGLGMAVAKFANKNIGDGVTYGTWLKAFDQLVNAYFPTLGLSGYGMGMFAPASFSVPDNPVLNGSQRAIAAASAQAAAAAAASSVQGMRGVYSAYGQAY